MATSTAAPPEAPSRRRRPTLPPAVATLRPVWSKPAAFRAARATLVIPALFAITHQVIGNLQMSTFAAFGGFATLVLASFGGTRRDKLVAHLGLGLVGSVLLIIGTAVTSSTPLAAGATVVVAFCVLFAGIAGPNAASGGTAALLAYVLPAASPGTVSMIPSRLEGWWLATAAGTLAVLILSPRPESDRLRSAAADCAAALSHDLAAILNGNVTDADTEAAIAAKHVLTSVFASTPYRPIGLASSDQALANLVETLEWCTVVATDMITEGTDLTSVPQIDRDLLGSTSEVLSGVAEVLRGGDTPLSLDRLEELHDASAARIAAVGADESCTEREVHISFHARIAAAAARSAALDTLLACRRADRSVVAGERLRWHGDANSYPVVRGARATLRTARQLAGRHASLRSVWFLNSARGALALAAAVAVADVTNVQHGFWVVLGTLSVLRTSAASTGSTAMRALAGTVAGFFIGAGLILAIGKDTGVLWAVLPLAILVAAYSPGTAPFAVGQAAFTVTVSVLYNILVPVGWKVGVLRVEDVAIGAAVSAVVGVLFWPRGAGSIVADDLADAFHDGGIYLVQATSWAVGARQLQPDAGGRAENAGLRLDDALRSLMAEQGTKRVGKEQVWRLVGGTMRLRLTAQSLSSLPNPETSTDPARSSLVEEAARLAGWCDGVAGQLGRSAATVAQELASAVTSEVLPVPAWGYLLWVRHHLDHLRHHLVDLVEPIGVVAEARAVPWWR
jgi:uncharacterized membrane protein YccC